MATLLQRLDDKINPIVVKELRQAVQSRFVSSALYLFLILQIIILGAFLFKGSLDQERNIDFHAGRETFLVLQGILLGTCMLFMPAYTGARLAAERSDTNTDLLFITTLRPRSIVAGKFLAANILAFLIFCACAPFMTFTYLLRGIDIPTIVMVLAIDFLSVIAGTQLAILVAAIPANRVGKSFLGLIAIGMLLTLFGMTLAGTISLVEFGAGFSERWEFWAAMGTTAAIALASIGLVFTWSVAVVSPPSANRALPVRLFLTAIWIVSLLVAAAWSFKIEEYFPMFIWLMIMAGTFSSQILIAINEREHWGPRVTRMIPRNPVGRWLAFLCYSGAGGGVLFALLILGMTFGITLLGEDYFHRYWAPSSRRISASDYKIVQSIANAVLYTIGYSLTAVLLRSYILTKVKPIFTWVLAGILVGLGSVIPYLVGYLFFSGNTNWWFNQHLWLITNPFAAVMEWNGDQGDAFLKFGLGWAGIMIALCLPWFVKQVMAFHPPVRKRPVQELEVAEVVEAVEAE